MEHGRNLPLIFLHMPKFQLHWTRDSSLSHQDFSSSTFLCRGPLHFPWNHSLFDETLPSSYRQSWGSVFWVTRAFFTVLSFLISCVFIFLREKWTFLFALKSFGFFLISLKWVGFYYDLCQKRFWVIISLPCFFLISAFPVLSHPMASLTLCHMQPWVPSSLSPHFLFPL